MEVFTGGGIMSSDVVLFPDNNLTPFPVTTTVDHRFQPPQKLRPIRSNGGRCFPECSDHPTTSVEAPPPGLGFLPDISMPVLKIEECSGNDFRNLSSPVDAELSSSSDDANESQEASKEGVNKKKRKRRSRKKLEVFLESMMRRVMQKQEEMHMQLIEMLEKKEKERIMREEAWRQQEIERAKREKQARAEETSRSLALISFIQKFLGNETKIPKSLETSYQDDKEEGENHNPENSQCDPSNNQEEWNSNLEDSECDPNCKRWPKSEVQALITVRTALNNKFYVKGPKGSVWEEVAAGLSNLGYNRNAKKCKEKWENINKYYKRTMERGKRRADNSKVCTYFSELDLLYQNGFITSGNPNDCLENGNEDLDQTMKE